MNAPTLHTNTDNISEAEKTNVLRPTESNSGISEIDSIEIESIEDACHAVAGHYYGERGLWIYRAFHWINRTLFSYELPCPLILIGLTAHGSCLGWNASPLLHAKPPTIMLHPSLWGGTEKANPWGYPPHLLGDRFALDILIHECIHVSVSYRLGRLGDQPGETSHNNPDWVAEVNRIAPLLELHRVEAGLSKVVREGKITKRKSLGNVPFAPAVSGFPSGLRLHWNHTDYYRDRSPLAFE